MELISSPHLDLISAQVHQPEKPNPLLGVLGDVAFPLLVIAGLLFLRSRAPGGGGIPGQPCLPEGTHQTTRLESERMWR
jgi:cell division protease FtsH